MPPKTPIVVVGARGMVGTALANLLVKRGLKHARVGRPECDLTDASSLARTIPSGTSTVLNCAAFTDVDGAEQDEQAALAVNGEGVKNLAARCVEMEATLVHYSTDYVFDGRATEPYPVDHVRDPINAYGRTKAAGEQHLNASDVDTLLVRTSWVYAPWANNFVRTMASLAKNRERLRVVDDQRGRPTSAEHLARITLALLERGARGSFHVTDGGECTWYELAKEIAAHVNPTCVVKPCRTIEFPRPAPRPGYSVLDLAKTEALVGPMPSWQNNLAAVLARITW